MNVIVADNATAQMVQFDRFMLGVNTAIPGIIRSFNPDTKLAKVQPAIAMKIMLPEKIEFINLPIIENVPVCLPHSLSAGLYITVPIKEGDECLLIFSQRAIDRFVLFGGLQTPPIGDSPLTSCVRHHDMTDAICIPGIITFPQQLENWSNEAIEVRNGDGTSKISIYTDKINANTPVINVVAPNVNIKGHIEVDGDIHSNGDIVAGTISLMHHIHDGVMPGGGDTTEPIP